MSTGNHHFCSTRSIFKWNYDSSFWFPKSKLDSNSKLESDSIILHTVNTSNRYLSLQIALSYIFNRVLITPLTLSSFHFPLSFVKIFGRELNEYRQLEYKDLDIRIVSFIDISIKNDSLAINIILDFTAGTNNHQLEKLIPYIVLFLYIFIYLFLYIILIGFSKTNIFCDFQSSCNISTKIQILFMEYRKILNSLYRVLGIFGRLMHWRLIIGVRGWIGGSYYETTFVLVLLYMVLRSPF